MNFNEKVVLVTGAGVGIGRAAAILFARQGAKVVINSLTPKNGEETLKLAQEYSDSIYIQADVSKDDESRRLVENAIAAFGRIDILVNNAGIVIPGRVDNMAETDWDNTINVNMKSVFLVSKYTIAHMKKQGGGVIVNNASAVALKGVKDRAAYAASKGGLVALTKAMAADYLDDHIRVNCVCPGTTETPSLSNRIAAFQDAEKARNDFVSRQPMKRFGTPEEIATAILFASCDEAAFMNGSVISIDGGMTI